jgi:carboxypeptidase C (cathepsin A)
MSNSENPNEKSPVPPRTLKGATTEHTLSIGTKTLHYRAVAEAMVLHKKEKPNAEMFYVYYSERVETERRPITFVFNGGPGAASAYLHVGSLGPRRAAFGVDGSVLPPPAQLVDNESTWLQFTDLVFVDPIGTGFSRIIDNENSKQPGGDAHASAGAGAGKPTETPPENEEYFKIKRDLESLGEFISKFLSKYGLWSRPVFIAGESYGGFRVGKLARKLQEEFGVGLSGAILISPALELTLLEGSDYDVSAWSDLFPSMVAASVFHGKSQAIAKGAILESFLPEVERFASHDLVRLLAGMMSESERAAAVKQMARYLGLSEKFIDDRSGRVSATQFTRELLRDARSILGLYDASMTSVDPFPDRDSFQGADPTLYSIYPVFTGAINSQLREALKVETERDYHLISMKVNEAWKVDTRQHDFQSHVGATDDLRYAMALNPHMKVFITHGYYDLVTPYFSTNRISGQMKLTVEQRRNLTVQHFNGGHMFYTWQESRRKFTESIKSFYFSALGSL